MARWGLLSLSPVVRFWPAKPDCGNGPVEKKGRVGGKRRECGLSRSGLRWRPALMPTVRGPQGAGTDRDLENRENGRLERGIAVRQGVRFLRAALPDILARQAESLSPRMVAVITDLSGDLRHLDERLDEVTA